MANPKQRNKLRKVLDLHWPALLPEQKAQLAEQARFLSLTPTTRRLLHELADLEATEGRAGIAARLQRMRASLVREDHETPPVEPEPTPRSEASESIVSLLDQASGFDDLLLLVSALGQLGPVSRGHAVSFVVSLAERNAAAAFAAGRSAFQRLEHEVRQQRAWDSLKDDDDAQQ